jgi:hypothetical protein
MMALTVWGRALGEKPIPIFISVIVLSSRCTELLKPNLGVDLV